MRPHPRIRKTIKWGGAAVTVLLVVVWIGSGWFLVRWGPASGWAVFTEYGISNIVYAPKFYNGRGAPTIERREWPAGTGPAPFRLGVWYAHRIYGKPTDYAGQEEHWFVPHWPFVAMTGFATMLAWRADSIARRRARLNVCPKCSYDRAGIAKDAKCPECGQSAA